MPKILLLIFPIAISLANNYGIKTSNRTLSNKQALQSFSAGLSIAYVFKILIPEIATSPSQSLNESMTLLVLGFSIFHITLKYIAKNNDPRRRDEFTEIEHVFVASLYNFLIGFVLIEHFEINFKIGLLLFVVVSVHSILMHLRHKHNESFNLLSLNKARLVIFSPIIGGLFAILNPFNSQTTITLLSLTAGCILYIATREEIPLGREGKPFFFIIGLLSVILLFGYN
ncbi:MAG: hypothetical protein Q9M91_02770 [Candidatus Dojkabacteria bacterium]|nr:hypothetical protein [Candidatus Dojkabacteria bacterium]MDQ7020747.1 hypothetical protein [Candidatus Dojkabacteria bacterium]